MEMWCGLTLQTLTKQTLLQYLPVVRLSSRAGCHLNVASPLNQRVRSDIPNAAILGDIYKSDDSALREFYKERGREFRELRNSDDPQLRNYWWDAQKRGCDTRMNNYRDTIRKKALEGTEVVLFIGKTSRSQQFYLGTAEFRIPKSIATLDSTKPLHIQCVITETPDEDRYAKEAHDSEDAARLLIRICGTTSNGEAFGGITQAGGEKTMFKANFLYDMLVGRSLAESLELPGRHRRKRAGRPLMYTTYT
jgi:hypothetical protein